MSLEKYFAHRAAEAEEDRQWYEERPGNWQHERAAEEERDYWLARADRAHSSSFHLRSTSRGLSSVFDDDDFDDGDDW